MDSRKYSWRRFAIIGIPGVLFFVIVGPRSLPRVLDITTIAARPALSSLVRSRRTITSFLTAPWEVKKLERALAQRVEGQQQVVKDQVRLVELERENRALRAELNFKEETRYPLVAAQVIAKIVASGGDFFVLNRGERDGLGRGQPVVIDGALVGKIGKATTFTAIVAPLSNAGIKTAATFSGKELTSGIVEGEASATLSMKLIPKDVTVTAGLIVITSGLETGIPRGLMIGQIIETQTFTQELFQNAYLQPTNQLQEGKIVSVLKNFTPITAE